MMESSERELIENRILELRETIKNAKELKILFEPSGENSNVLLINATEDKQVFNLRRFIKNNHVELLSDDDFNFRNYADEDFFENKYLVKELLHKARGVIDDKILTITKEIVSNESSLRGDTANPPISSNENIQEEKLSDRKRIRIHLKKENIDLSQVENITIFSKDLKKQLHLNSKQSAIRRFLHELRK